MPRCDFQFAGRAVRVEAAEEPLAWLREFVAPHFAVGDTSAPDRAIGLTIDAKEHARLAAQGPREPGLARACFTLDSGIAHGHVWNAPDATDVVFDEAMGTFYRHDRRESSVVEVVAARDGAETRLALLRAVREYAMLYAVRAGWVMLHAAAVSVGENAFVVAGPKRAGKTTLLLHALSTERAAYIANDRVALAVGPSGVTAHGLPTIVSVRKESAAWFPDLAARFARGGYHYGRRMAERNGDQEAPSTTARPTWGLSPGQLCDVLGAPMRASAHVAAVLFPRLGASTGSPTFEALDTDQTWDAWRSSLLRACPADGMFTIGPDAAADPDGGAGRLAALVPSFVCHLGPDAYGAGTRWLSSVCADLAARTAPRCPRHSGSTSLTGA